MVYESPVDILIRLGFRFSGNRNFNSSGDARGSKSARLTSAKKRVLKLYRSPPGPPGLQYIDRVHDVHGQLKVCFHRQTHTHSPQHALLLTLYHCSLQPQHWSVLGWGKNNILLVLNYVQSVKKNVKSYQPHSHTQEPMATTCGLISSLGADFKLDL